MKKIILPFLLFFSMQLVAQIPNGSIAPNFTATDLDGNEHNLYDILASGRDVIIDFSATWCGPCWSFHNSGILEELNELVGPEGSNEAMILMVESDVTTSLEDLYGTGSNTLGDWVTGTDYPILNSSSVASKYQIGAYPTIMKVCQDRRVLLIPEIRSEGVDFGVETLALCPSVEYASEPFFYADKYTGCGTLDVQFSDDSWPRPETYLWDFGDGNTSTEQSPAHSYTESGDYSVSLDVGNSFGNNMTTKADLIKIGSGEAKADQNVGPENFDFGGGDYFVGGHQALVFNANKDLIISTVKVFSASAATRTVVLLNESGDLLQTKDIFIGEGEHTIALEFFVPQGSNYRLGLRSDAFLYRNNSGTSYPYEIDGLISIHSSTASSNPSNYYYYFYNWEVREDGCEGSSANEEIAAETFEVFPNPSSGIVNLKSTNTITKEIIVYNIWGQRIMVDSNIHSNSVQIDLSDYPAGLYLFEIDGQTKKVMLDK